LVRRPIERGLKSHRKAFSKKTGRKTGHSPGSVPKCDHPMRPTRSPSSHDTTTLAPRIGVPYTRARTLLTDSRRGLLHWRELKLASGRSLGSAGHRNELGCRCAMPIHHCWTSRRTSRGGSLRASRAPAASRDDLRAVHAIANPSPTIIQPRTGWPSDKAKSTITPINVTPAPTAPTVLTWRSNESMNALSRLCSDKEIVRGAPRGESERRLWVVPVADWLRQRDPLPTTPRRRARAGALSERRQRLLLARDTAVWGRGERARECPSYATAPIGQHLRHADRLHAVV
jgi:hypothetical protein